MAHSRHSTSTLILGGARSGKSARAQRLAEERLSQRIYVATAEAFDEEMADRIKRHQSQRGDGWMTVEAPVDLVTALQSHAAPDRVVLVDCLTLWLSNLMGAKRDVELECAKLVNWIETAAGHVIFVSNEIGLGLVPETPLGRAFRDAQGRLNQSVAAACDRVEFIAAGLPIELKG